MHSRTQKGETRRKKVVFEEGVKAFRLGNEGS